MDKLTLPAAAPGRPTTGRFDVRTPAAAVVVLSAAIFVVREGVALLAPLLVSVLLITGEGLKGRLIRMAGPHLERRKVTLDAIRSIDRQIARYLVARAHQRDCRGGDRRRAVVPQRQPLARAGPGRRRVNVFPIVGPTAGVAVIAAATFVQFHSIEMTAAAGGLAGLLAALEGNLISPWLTGRAGELNTVAVFVSVLFWGWMWEGWGLVLLTIKAAADHIEPLQPLGELLGR